MPGAPLVDAIGAACTVTRRTEPRIAGQAGPHSAMRGPC